MYIKVLILIIAVSPFTFSIGSYNASRPDGFVRQILDVPNFLLGLKTDGREKVNEKCSRWKFVNIKYPVSTVPVSYKKIYTKLYTNRRIEADLKPFIARLEMRNDPKLPNDIKKARTEEYMKSIMTDANRGFPPIQKENLQYVTNANATHICLGFKNVLKEDPSLLFEERTRGGDVVFSKCSKSIIPKKMQGNDYVWVKVHLTEINAAFEKRDSGIVCVK